MGVSEKLGNLGAVTTTLDTAINWARTGAHLAAALWPGLLRD